LELNNKTLEGVRIYRPGAMQVVIIIVLKPGPARRVEPGPDRPGPGTGPGLSKNLPGS